MYLPSLLLSPQNLWGGSRKAITYLLFSENSWKFLLALSYQAAQKPEGLKAVSDGYVSLSLPTFFFFSSINLENLMKNSLDWSQIRSIIWLYVKIQNTVLCPKEGKTVKRLSKYSFPSLLLNTTLYFLFYFFRKVLSVSLLIFNNIYLYFK